MKHLKQEKNYKKTITKIIIYIIILIISIATIIKVKNLNVISDKILDKKSTEVQSSSINISDELKKEKEFQGMIIKDINISRENGITNLTANIENNTENKFEEREIKIIFQNEDNTQISILKTKLKTIEKGETAELNISTSLDLTQAYNFRIE